MSESSDISKEEQDEINYRELLLFFVPLAVTPFFITITHSLMNASMARLPYPEISIAVLSVIKGLSAVIRAPSGMFMQIIISRVNDRKSFITASKFIWSVCGIMFAILFILGFTPAGGWVLRNIIGLQDPRMIEFGYLALKITCFLPLAATFRNINRGLIISHKQTKYSSAATATRLILVTLFLLWAIYREPFSGIVASSLAWTVGIGIEGLMVFLGVIYLFKTPGRAAEKLPKVAEGAGDKLKLMGIVGFFMPLALMRFLRSAARPIIQSGIARSPVNPTYALAAFGVAFGIVRIVTGPVVYLHNCALVYMKEDNERNWKRIKMFSLLTGLLGTITLILLPLTPAGFWILHNLIGVSEEIAHTGSLVLLAFSPYPLIRAQRESCWGLLMNKSETGPIGIAKGANIGTIFAVTVLFVTIFTGIFQKSPAVIGTLIFCLGHALETLMIRYYTANNVKMVSDSMGRIESWFMGLIWG